jgi:hypothetical protein
MGKRARRRLATRENKRVKVPVGPDTHLPAVRNSGSQQANPMRWRSQANAGAPMAIRLEGTLTVVTASILSLAVFCVALIA